MNRFYMFMCSSCRLTDMFLCRGLIVRENSSLGEAFPPAPDLFIFHEVEFIFFTFLCCHLCQRSTNVAHGISEHTNVR